jgi:cytochrome c556
MVLAAGIVVLAISSTFSACDEEEQKATKEAQQDILKLVDAKDKGNGDAKAQVEAIHKKYDELKPVMNIFKPRDKGGIGVGPKGKGDGIELRIKAWGSKRPPSPTDLKRMANEIERAAKIALAVADVADLYVPKKDPDKWKKYNQDMREGAEEWAKAARSGDPAQFKKASNKLDASCTDCHGDFRD